MVTDEVLGLVEGRSNRFQLLAALVNPDHQFGEVFQGQLLDGLFDFLNPAHYKKIRSFH